MNEIDEAIARVEGKPLPEGHDMAALDPMGSVPVAPAHAIAGVALNLAMKYHDMSIVKDGTLYQQYKLEGRNIQTIGLADVFETAIKIEAHLLGASERIAKLVVDAITFQVEDDECSSEPISQTTSQTTTDDATEIDQGETTATGEQTDAASQTDASKPDGEAESARTGDLSKDSNDKRS